MSTYSEIERKIKEEGPLKKLELENVVVDGFPEALWEQPLEHLSFNEVSISGGFPLEVFSLSTLKSLQLNFLCLHSDSFDTEEYINELPIEIGQLVHLHTLDLCGNLLSELPKELMHLKNLMNLDLSENRLREDVDLYLPENIERLDISLNELSKIPASVMQLIFLKKIIFTNNKIENLSGIPLSVEVLDGSYNPFGDFSMRNDQFPNLHQLTLRSCGIYTFDFIQDEFAALEKLDVSYNQLSVVGSSIQYLKNSKTLNLSHNKIEKIGASIGSLSHLEALYLAHNKLHELPVELERLERLLHLDISSNNFKRFPVSVYDLMYLETFVGSWNEFQMIPKGVSALKKLKSIHLHKSNISTIADDFSELISLEQCDLGYNTIKVLPSIKKLNHLKYLGLNGLTQLKDLSSVLSEITNCNSLTLLSLVNIPLDSLPVSLKSNKKLKRIDIGKKDWSMEKKKKLKEIFDPIYLWLN